MDTAVHHKLIKMAAQAVLFEYKPLLQRLPEEDSLALLDRIADEIAAMAKEMEQITDATWKGLTANGGLSLISSEPESKLL